MNEHQPKQQDGQPKNTVGVTLPLPGSSTESVCQTLWGSPETSDYLVGIVVVSKKHLTVKSATSVTLRVGKLYEHTPKTILHHP